MKDAVSIGTLLANLLCDQYGVKAVKIEVKTDEDKGNDMQGMRMAQ